MRRKISKAAAEGTCPRCRGAIRIGDSISHDMTRHPVHSACATFHVRHVKEGPRYKATATGKPCEGCGKTILGTEASLTVSTLPWHAECRKAWVRM